MQEKKNFLRTKLKNFSHFVLDKHYLCFHYEKVNNTYTPAYFIL